MIMIMNIYGGRIMNNVIIMIMIMNNDGARIMNNDSGHDHDNE